MTRINTNVSSLIAQKTLARSNDDLQTALTRLSTGLRINVGKDDPAGLIASESLRSDIISVEKAITNSERANQLIATADSALGQVSQLLNDIRGLVSEAANTGALSDDQIAANQLQIDSSLEAVDRIAQITSFQGQRLLDGNLDFITTGVNTSAIEGLQVDQANFGTQSSIGVQVNVVNQATRGTLNYAFGAVSQDVVLEIGGANGTEAFNFASGSTIEEIAAAVNLVSDATGVEALIEQDATKGEITVSSTGLDNDIVLQALNAGESAGDIRVKYTEGGTSDTNVVYTAASGANPATIEVQLQTQAYVASESLRLDDDNLTQTTATYRLDANGDGTTDAEDLTLTANSTGAQYHGVTLNLVNDDSLQSGAAAVSFNDATKELTVRIDSGVTTSADIKTAFDNANAAPGGFGFSATGGDATAIDANSGVPAAGTTVLTQTADGIGDDNNALDIVAKIGGTAFNDVAVHFVDGNGTAAGITADFVQRSSTFYGDDSTTPANNDNDFQISTVAGGAFDGLNGGDITVNFVDSNAGDAVDSVEFDEDTGELTITADFSGNVTAAAVITAVNGATTDQGNALSDFLFAETVNGTGGDNVGAGIVGQDGATLGASGTVAQGVIGLAATGVAGEVTLTAKAGTKFDGAAGNGISVVLADSANTSVGVDSVVFDENTGVLTITADFTNSVTAATVDAALDAATTVQGNSLDDFFTIANSGGTFAGGDAFAATLLADTTGASAAAGTGDIASVAGAGINHEQISYSHEAQAAQASITFGANGSNNDLILTAVSAGTDFNDVAIKVVGQAGGAGLTNSVAAAYDENAKELTITYDNTDGAITTQAIIDAVEADGTFTVAVDATVETGNLAGNGTVDGTTLVSTTEVGNTGNSGGEAGTLFVHVESGKSTSQKVITALGSAGNERANELFSISNSQDSDGSGLIFTNTHDGDRALSGGIDGGAVVATATEVVDKINASGAGAIISAALATGNSGSSAVSAFQEFAFQGSAEAGNRLQFLGIEGAQNISFVSNAGSALGVDSTTDPQVLAKSRATLAAQNANASLTFSAVNQGAEYDDTVIRFTSVHEDTANNTVTYDSEESYATALLDLGGANSDVRLTANTRGADLNGYSINVVDTGAVTTNDATVTVDNDAKTITIDVDALTTANKVIEKVNAEGTFTAELDYSQDTDNAGTGVGLTTDNSNALASTGTTGGHKGTLEFNITAGTTADEVLSLLNNDDLANKFFNATSFGTSGTGAIDLVNDSNKAVTDGGVESDGTFIVNLETDENGLIKTTAQDLVDFLAGSSAAAAAGISASLAEGADGTGLLSATTSDITFTTNGTDLTDSFASGEVVAVNGVNARFSVTAVDPGSDYDGVSVVYESSLATAGTETAAYNDTTKTITVQIKAGAGASTASQVVAAITNDLSDKFSTSLSGTGAAAVSLSDTGTLSGGVVDLGTEDGAAFIGNEDLSDSGLTFQATQFGSDGFVQVKALTGTFSLSNASGTTTDRSVGADIDARINGIQAIGRGLKASINTSSLDLSFSLSQNVVDDTTLNFQISGGGALFQLGPDVVSNQQARLGIQSVSTATLGGVSGRLFELRSGGAKALDKDAGGAAKIVDEVINVVTQLRGRLGAFQKTTLDSNIFTLNDTLANLTDAESSIRDADFAAESAKLTRAQILVQSGTSVLSIANSNPQNVLSLLR